MIPHVRISWNEMARDLFLHKRVMSLNQWFPTFFITFLPLLILELLIPPLLHKLFFHSSPITRVYENLIYGYILSRLPFTCHGELILRVRTLVWITNEKLSTIT